jgi:hypothetical protein
MCLAVTVIFPLSQPQAALSIQKRGRLSSKSPGPLKLHVGSAQSLNDQRSVTGCSVSGSPIVAICNDMILYACEIAALTAVRASTMALADADFICGVVDDAGQRAQAWR